MAGIIRIEYFVLDTGPLLDFFVCLYDEQYHSTWLSTVISPAVLKDETLKDGFRSFLNQHKGRLLTSSGVIAELQQHILRAEKRAHSQNHAAFYRRFWMLVQTEMRQLGFDEDTCRLVYMDTNMLTNLGPVDTSIIELAKQNIGSYKKFIVLTSDDGVYERCIKEQVPVERTEDRIEKFIIESL